MVVSKHLTDLIAKSGPLAYTKWVSVSKDLLSAALLNLLTLLDDASHIKV